MNEIIINPVYGLCNRLRFMFSFIKRLKDNKKLKNNKIIILWENNEQCNGNYLDYFKKINKNIEFIKINSNYNKDKGIVSCSVIEEYKNKNYLYNNYPLLNKYISKKIKNIIYELKNDYIAIHIRRGDLDEHLKAKNIYHKRTKDEDFINFIKKNNKSNLYIATDCKKTQEYFLSKFKDKIKYMKNITYEKNIKKTNLEDAIIDLYLCVCSKKFKGTWYSSYSYFIDLLRKNVDSNVPLECLKKFS